MEFVNDDRVIGKWENIGWTSSTDSLSVTDLNAKSGEYNILFFLPGLYYHVDILNFFYHLKIIYTN